MKKTFWVLLVSFFTLIFILGACSPKDSSTSPAAPQPTATVSANIYYTVTGNVGYINVDYYTPVGYVTEATEYTLPYASSTYTFSSGQQIGILVTNDSVSAGTITVNTYKNGSIWKTITVTIGSNGTVSENGSL